MATSQAKRQQYTTTIHAVRVRKKKSVARFHRNGDLMYMAQKAKKKASYAMRKYYDMQKTFDSLCMQTAKAVSSLGI